MKTNLCSGTRYLCFALEQRKGIAIAILNILSCFYSIICQADIALQEFSHRKHIIPGERSALMGGAFTALSDDSSGLYFNPAGISYTERKQESIAMLYSEYSQHTEYRNAIADLPFKESSRSRFASISGGVFKKSPFTFGYSFLTLDHRSINQDDSFEGLTNTGALQDFSRIHLENTSLTLVGGGGAYQISKSFSIGLSAFHYQRHNELMDAQLAGFSDGSIFSYVSKAETNNEGFIPILGFVYRPENFAIGISAQRVHATSDKTTAREAALVFDGTSSEVSSTNRPIQTTLYKEPQLDTYSLGLAYFGGKYLTLSTDLNYYKISEQNATSRDTLNYAGGLEITLRPIRLNYGWFTNHTLFRPLENGQMNQAAHINFTGQSFGVSVVSKDIDIALGAVLQEGKGHAQIVIDDVDVQEVRSETEMYFVAGSYRF